MNRANPLATNIRFPPIADDTVDVTVVPVIDSELSGLMERLHEKLEERQGRAVAWCVTLAFSLTVLVAFVALIFGFL